MDLKGFLYGPEEVSYGGAAVKKKRLGQFLLKVPISIPYMVRIIQANFKKWTTIVIIYNILADFPL